VEDAHMMIAHSLCVALRERLRLQATDRVQTPVVGLLTLEREGDPSVAL
jgi:hypothetical protein